MLAKHIALSQRASSVLELLTGGGLSVGDARKIDRGLGFKTVYVERLDDSDLGAVFAVAHYLEHEGCFVPHPEMIFIRCAAGWIPASFNNCVVGQRDAVVWIDDERVEVDDREHRDVVSLAELWLRNIGEQQALPKGDEP